VKKFIITVLFVNNGHAWNTRFSKNERKEILTFFAEAQKMRKIYLMLVFDWKNFMRVILAIG